ncbi:Ltp family lipoprotein [Nocardioides zeae]|uniref:Putative host cell surface-exposed lipoprotein Ltp-like HTH region domain-containing protein n=1 Tax=Nocardioides zeae TaxID=1457234 RepID=A0A6P0HHB0_9ACTN|nr:Ltp family lipoprotein [Nocardioides zeae]NEN77660.1 hypothetical protein [Nocardioides zeae]
MSQIPGDGPEHQAPQRSPYAPPTPQTYAAGTFFPPGSVPPAKKPWFKRKLVWGIAAVVLVGGAAAGGSGTGNSGKDDDEKPVAAEASSPSPDASPVDVETPAASESPAQAAAPEPAPEPEPEPEPELTVGQENAVRSAESYLDFAPFSRSGLIDQLEFEGYETAEAEYAVDNIDVDWNDEAAEAAEGYLDMMGFSRSGLIEQLQFEGYTAEQAAFGVAEAGL